MAASDLNHLKNSYRTRFCHTRRSPKINVKPGQNILETVQNCFEESHDRDPSLESSSPAVSPGPTGLEDICYLSPSEEVSPVQPAKICWLEESSSSVLASPQTAEGIGNPVRTSGTPQGSPVPAVVSAKTTPALSSPSKSTEKAAKGPHGTEDFYLAVGPLNLMIEEEEVLSLPSTTASPVRTRGRSHPLEDSASRRPSSPTVELKSKKRLNFNEKAALSVEKEAEVGIKRSEKSQRKKRVEESIQGSVSQTPKKELKTKRNVSSIFLDAVKIGNDRLSFYRHSPAAAPRSPSPPPNNPNPLPDDEFIIDESDSCASTSWISIPRKSTRSGNRGPEPPAARTQARERTQPKAQRVGRPKTPAGADGRGGRGGNGDDSDTDGAEGTSRKIIRSPLSEEKSQRRNKSDGSRSQSGREGIGRPSVLSRAAQLSEKMEPGLQHQGEKSKARAEDTHADGERPPKHHTGREARDGPRKDSDFDKGAASSRSDGPEDRSPERRSPRLLHRHSGKPKGRGDGRRPDAGESQKKSVTPSSRGPRGGSRDDDPGGDLDQNDEGESARQKLPPGGKRKNKDPVEKIQDNKKGSPRTPSVGVPQKKRPKVLTEKRPKENPDPSRSLEIRTSRRVSRPPSDWWMLKDEPNGTDQNERPTPKQRDRGEPPQALEVGETSLAPHDSPRTDRAGASVSPRKAASSQPHPREILDATSSRNTRPPSTKPKPGPKMHQHPQRRKQNPGKLTRNKRKQAEKSVGKNIKTVNSERKSADKKESKAAGLETLTDPTGPNCLLSGSQDSALSASYSIRQYRSSLSSASSGITSRKESSAAREQRTNRGGRKRPIPPPGERAPLAELQKVAGPARPEPKKLLYSSSGISDSGNIVANDEPSGVEEFQAGGESEPGPRLKGRRESAAKRKARHAGSTAKLSEESLKPPELADPPEEAEDPQSTLRSPLTPDTTGPVTSTVEGSGPVRSRNTRTFPPNDEARVYEREDDLSSDDAEYPLDGRSQPASNRKAKQKFVLPTNTPNVRRTKRIRVKPLEYWRGERVNYKVRPSGGFEIHGIISPDAVSPYKGASGKMENLNKLAKRKGRPLEKEKKKNAVANLDLSLGDPSKPTSVWCHDTNQEVLLSCVRPKGTYTYCLGDDSLMVYKSLNTASFSAGKLVLGPFKVKGNQHVCFDTLVFYIIQGELICTLCKTPYYLTAGDTFYVPPGNLYNIQNLLNQKSILLFTQIKSERLEGVCLESDSDDEG
ncbi:centromere protein C [Tachyglossus aculeatus]|uniref:centromere protein C n=1 Tax=Tachyglossus aculeatus TaxID=9261 RepID=UPI0018F5563B|nr:centromere protein C [Tachyglossus aculeatus]